MTGHCSRFFPCQEVSIIRRQPNDKQTNHFEIHRLKDMQFSIRQIAKTLNLDRGTVARYIKQPDITCKARRGRPSKLYLFREFIKEMVEQYPKINAPVVLRQIRNKGFGCKSNTVSLNNRHPVADRLHDNLAVLIHKNCKPATECP